MPNTDLRKLEDSRVTSDFLIDTRGFRMEHNGEWKNRQRDIDEMYRGDFSSRWAGEFNGSDGQLTVMNLIQTGLDDLGRLASENRPIIKCPPLGDSQKQAKEANIREAIAHSYWDYNHGEGLVPRLAMDLGGSGAAFVVVSWADCEYPKFVRVDPRFCYPDVHNGKLQDLFVIRTMRVRQAYRQFPGLVDMVRPEDADSCEILEYYSADECVQGALLTKGGSPRGEPLITKRYIPDLDGKVPVAFAQMDSYDGQFRGMFDQIAGVMRTKNRVVQQVVDYADQMVYAPMVTKGVLNPTDPPGPNTVYRLDPNVPDAQFGRVEPAGTHPQMWQLLDFLDSEQRAGASYPVQRHGEVSQSIASAAFVNSTMGQLTTAVRNIQRLIGQMRTDLNEIGYCVDERHLDSNKPLLRSIGNKKTYTPSQSIGGKYYNYVSYGAGAGLDRANADVRIIQHEQQGIISKETAREQVDFIVDPAEEQDKIERESAAAALMQKVLTEAPTDMVMKLYVKMNQGNSLAEAVEELMEEEQGSGAAPQPPSGGAPGLPSGPPDAGAAQTALEKGGIPGNAPSLPSAGPSGGRPLKDVVVKPPA